MTNIETAIKAAIDAGYEPKNYNGYNKNVPLVVLPFLLDPLAWQAMGKSLGWYEHISPVTWRDKWHRFIDALSEGDTYEDAMGKILNV